ncbi:MAG TPA: OmpA family protein [Polyangiaceae bacterium]|jgi:outer membrane protein OmpA-like peptidoglycan-associated protein|nr:OmpA family protein [Polyangiaceae bacterium]
MKLSRSVATAAFAVLLTARAGAANSAGFTLDRLSPSDRGSAWFSLDSLDYSRHDKFALGVLGSYTHHPLVVYDLATGAKQTLVNQEFVAHIGGSYYFGNLARIGLDIPALNVTDATARTVDGELYAPASGVHFGDLRLSGDIALLPADGPIRVGIGAQLTLPTGKSKGFAGDDKVGFIPRATAGGRIKWFEYGAQLGVNVRGGANFSGQSVGSDARFAAAAGFTTENRRWLVGPEVFGRTSISGGSFSKQGTPVEALLGGHYFSAGGVSAGLGVGTGLSRGFGAPDVRAVGSLEWTPVPTSPEAPKQKPDGDRDHDGIADSKDGCPDDAEDKDGFEDEDGCPEFDNDKDGIADKTDKCPNQAEDVDGFEDEDGCPDNDNDKDGIADVDDKCPIQAEDKDGWQDEDGCPDPDNDGDNLPDAVDKCPNEPETVNGRDDEDGCPDLLRVDQYQIKTVEPVYFEHNSAVIQTRSAQLIAEMASVIGARADLGVISIEGHTDSNGSAKRNQELSQARAESVAAALEKLGVPKERLTAKGYGPTRPVADNKTSDGRAQNRRVEFRIMGAAGAANAAPASEQSNTGNAK